jgi:hypothetical protein
MVGQLKTHAQEVSEVLRTVVTHDESLKRLNLSGVSEPAALPGNNRTTQACCSSVSLDMCRAEKRLLPLVGYYRIRTISCTMCLM